VGTDVKVANGFQTHARLAKCDSVRVCYFRVLASQEHVSMWGAHPATQNPHSGSARLVSVSRCTSLKVNPGSTNDRRWFSNSLTYWPTSNPVTRNWTGSWPVPTLATDLRKIRFDIILLVRPETYKFPLFKTPSTQVHQNSNIKCLQYCMELFL
jgi:hypothetical protein